MLRQNYPHTKYSRRRYVPIRILFSLVNLSFVNPACRIVTYPTVNILPRSKNACSQSYARPSILSRRRRRRKSAAFEDLLSEALQVCEDIIPPKCEEIYCPLICLIEFFPKFMPTSNKKRSGDFVPVGAFFIRCPCQS